MVCGFNFAIDTAVDDCQDWLNSQPEVPLEHIETQRASLYNMLKVDTGLTHQERAVIERVEVMLFDYLVRAGAKLSPVVRDVTLGGDLVDTGFDSRAPGGNANE